VLSVQQTPRKNCQAIQIFRSTIKRLYKSINKVCMKLKNLPQILFKLDVKKFLLIIFQYSDPCVKLQRNPFTVLCITLGITRFIISTGWRTKCHTIDCARNTFLLLQKHLTSGAELIIIIIIIMCYVHNQWYDISWATLYFLCVFAFKGFWLTKALCSLLLSRNNIKLCVLLTV